MVIDKRGSDSLFALVHHFYLINYACLYVDIFCSFFINVVNFFVNSIDASFFKKTFGSKEY